MHAANLPVMDPAITATVIGVLLTVAFGAFATAFAWLRSDIGDRFDKVDARFDKVDARFEKMDARFERLETTVQALIVALARRGHLTDPNDSGPDD